MSNNLRPTTRLSVIAGGSNLPACPTQSFLPHFAFEHDGVAVEQMLFFPLNRPGNRNALAFYYSQNNAKLRNAARKSLRSQAQAKRLELADRRKVRDCESAGLRSWRRVREQIEPIGGLQR